MEKLIDSLDLYFIFKSIEGNYDFSNYEKRFLQAANERYGQYLTEHYPSKADRVVFKTKITSMEDFYKLQNYIEALDNLVKLTQKIITTNANIFMLNRRGFYDNFGALDLSSTEKVLFIIEKVNGSISSTGKSSEMFVNLNDNEPFALLYSTTVISLTEEQVYSLTEKYKTYSATKIVAKHEGYYLSRQPLEFIGEWCTKARIKKIKKLENKYANNFFLIFLLFVLVAGGLGFGISRISIKWLFYTLYLISFPGLVLLISFFSNLSYDGLDLRFNNKLENFDILDNISVRIKLRTRSILAYFIGYLLFSVVILLIQKANFPSESYAQTYIFLAFNLGVSILVFSIAHGIFKDGTEWSPFIFVPFLITYIPSGTVMNNTNLVTNQYLNALVASISQYGLIIGVGSVFIIVVIINSIRG